MPAIKWRIPSCIHNHNSHLSVVIVLCQHLRAPFAVYAVTLPAMKSPAIAILGIEKNIRKTLGVHLGLIDDATGQNYPIDSLQLLQVSIRCVLESCQTTPAWHLFIIERRFTIRKLVKLLALKKRLWSTKQAWNWSGSSTHRWTGQLHQDPYWSRDHRWESRAFYLHLAGGPVCRRPWTWRSWIRGMIA